jgi:excisionase family DNA binding protein
MSDSSLRNLLQNLEALQRALQSTQTALVEFEGDLLRQSSSLPEEQRSEEQRPGEQSDLGLLSISEVCRELGMGRSWVYRRLKSGEIPSIKLGHNIKVKRSELEQYLERQRYQPLSR